MKRKDKLGLLLLNQESTISSASGFLQANDVVILQTEEFGQVVSKEKLEQATTNTHPVEITEYLSPLLHEHEKGGAAAVVFLHNQQKADTEDEQKEEAAPHQSYSEPKEEENIAIDTTEEAHKSPRMPIPNFKNIIWPFIAATKTKLGFIATKLPRIELTRKRKLFLSLGVILIMLLVVGVIYTTKQKEKAIQQALFEEVYTQAQKKYDEGQGLAGLNKNLSRDDLTEAQKLITDNKDKFSNNKVFKEKLDALLKNVEDGLLAVSGVNRVDAKPTDKNASIMLSMALENNSIAVTQDEKSIYTIDDKTITSIDKKTKNKKTLVSNKDTWSTIGGIGAYIGNLYVLDRDAGQIFKFVGSNSSNYFGSKQDLSKATSIAIDGSIWILYSDGLIQKWTRGKQDSFTVSGLDEQFKNPTRISTDTESGNLYVLDNGNSRIVVIKKNGVYETQYQTDVVKTATEFDVVEKDKKIFVLNDKKVWEINLSSN